MAPSSVCAQHLPYSTHDWENDQLANWSEAWSDVATPGDGRTYTVGTTRAQHTDANNPLGVTFSGADGSSPLFVTQGPPGVADGANKVVAILQVADALGNIEWQRFFHGDGGAMASSVVSSTHARGISVFPGPTHAETRIAICGETYDQRLPLSALQNGAESGLQGETAGFVAVYDGVGTLLWTYLFYGRDVFAGTVIADVSIHIDYSGTQPLDVVTYCGLSANGVFVDPQNPAPTPLTPVNYFPAPPSLPGCSDVYPDGNPTNHPVNPQTLQPDPTLRSGQWDGIVGRLVRNHDGTGMTSQRFHAIVGGYADFEGLFGIAEKSKDEFVVVGTMMSGAAQGTVFPLTRSEWRGASVCLTGTSYVHGVLAEFDASLTVQGGPLWLRASTLIGGSGPGVFTVARDVIAHGGLYYVVGSTTGDDFQFNFSSTVVGAAGAKSGFLVATEDANQEFANGMYYPVSRHGVSGLVGVAGWNEYPDHIALSGWVAPTATGPKDLVAVSVFRDTAAPFQGSKELKVLRDHAIQSPGDEVSGAVDSSIVNFPSGLQSLGAGPSFATPFGLGDPGGGGLSVDPRGLLTVVGSTRGVLGYPRIPSPTPSNPNPPTRNASATLSANTFDAVRSVIDMLPTGICRSDRTGLCPSPGWSPAGNGGTTPACALSTFGSILGTTPVLQRMFLDYEGTPMPGQAVSLLVDRPPPASWVVLSGWQVGVPNPVPLLLTDHDVELWGMSSAIPPYLGALAPTGGSVRESFAVVPSGFVYMVQYVCLLAQPMAGTSCTAPDLTWAATPAMVFAY